MPTSHLTFAERCYELLKLVPRGKVTTYGEIARTLNGKAYRAVGTAMAKNPNPVVVPCHRVVLSDGRIGQYALGVRRKIELLTEEGVTVSNGKIDNFHTVMYRFST